MNKNIRGLSILVLGVVLVSLFGCSVCKTSYRRELSGDSNLREANVSYRKAIDWLDKAECASIPAQAEESYITAESYISDAIYKLKESQRKNNINVSEEVIYCERIRTETDVKIGAADRAK